MSLTKFLLDENVSELKIDLSFSDQNKLCEEMIKFREPFSSLREKQIKGFFNDFNLLKFLILKKSDSESYLKVIEERNSFLKLEFGKDIAEELKNLFEFEDYAAGTISTTYLDSLSFPGFLSNKDKVVQFECGSK